MTSRSREFDAVVVGAGTAGANAAYQLARRGMSVALLERRRFDDGGAHWHNGVLDWQFDRAGIEAPTPPERRPVVPRVHLVSPSGRVAIRMSQPPTVTADMAALGRRLRAACLDAGVEAIDQVDAVWPIVRGDRLTGLEFGVSATSDAEVRSRLEAPLFVDATGRFGILRNASPLLQPWCPDPDGPELCAASDFRFEIADTGGATQFLERYGALPGETVTMVGLAGGFSTQAITVASDLSHVSVLVGCLATGQYGTGPSMLKVTRSAEPWIGTTIGGGSGLIPLRRPYARFTAPGLALVGDAACQVFPAHGSGIGMGLMAGTVLAETVADTPAKDPGDEALLWRYQHTFMTEFGRTLASYEAVRRMSTALGTDGVNALMCSGVMSEHLARAGLDQRLATPRVRDLPSAVAHLGAHPGLAATTLPWFVRSRVAAFVGARTPDEPDLDALARWDRRMRAVLGPLPS